MSLCQSQCNTTVLDDIEQLVEDELCNRWHMKQIFPTYVKDPWWSEMLKDEKLVYKHTFKNHYMLVRLHRRSKLFETKQETPGLIVEIEAESIWVFKKFVIYTMKQARDFLNESWMRDLVQSEKNFLRLHRIITEKRIKAGFDMT